MVFYFNSTVTAISNQIKYYLKLKRLGGGQFDSPEMYLLERG